MVSDLLRDRNQLYQLVKEFHIESKAVVIASVSLIVAVLSLLMAWLAVYDAIQAKAVVEMQNERLAEMSRRIETQDAKIYMISQELN